MEQAHFLALAIVIGAHSTSLSARADDGSFAIGPADCRIANPDPRPGERATWSGGRRSGYADGNGVLQWIEEDQPESRYEGHMAGGRPDGHGVYVYPESHTRYEGEFRNGKRQGRGTLTQSCGTLVTGLWDKGWLIEERVEAENPNGCRYIGGWHNMRPQGEVTYDDGADYIGSFVDGERQGQGTLTCQDRTTTGMWRSNESDGATDIAGPGIYHFHGTYVDGKAQGEGELHDTDGSSYHGNFVRGEFQGQGTTTYANGARYAGGWMHGQWEGRGRLDFADEGATTAR